MILDAQNLYSDAQAITADAPSTNVIDHGADRNIGLGEPLSVYITIDVAAAGGGTLEITLQTDDDVSFGSPTTMATTGAVAAANLTAGSKVVLPLPADTLGERFTRLYYDVTTMTGITVTAALVPSNFIPSGNVFYASGYSVA